MDTLRCPQCNGPLTASRFARSLRCPYCGSTVLLDDSAVAAARFRAAYAAWNAPASWDLPATIHLGEQVWALGGVLRQDALVTVHRALRARWPTETADLELLRDPADHPRMQRQWSTLAALAEAPVSNGPSLGHRLPQPIAWGTIELGAAGSTTGTLFRHPHRFDHTAGEVARLHRDGIEPRAAIWVWRRTLEILAFVHAAGYAHGAVLPEHLLIQRGEHGIHLVGWTTAGPLGTPRTDPGDSAAGFLPPGTAAVLRVEDDLAMSARCLALLLDGNPATGATGDHVPAAFAETIVRVAHPEAAHRATPTRHGNLAWELREELGRLARQLWGPPAFCPIPLPPPASL